jgi:hypothetical protein
MAEGFWLTCIFLSFSEAPKPFCAKKSSSIKGLYTAPKIIFPSFSKPMLTQQMGMPLAKLMVPSIGSMIHLYSLSLLSSPVSSLKIK